MTTSSSRVTWPAIAGAIGAVTILRIVYLAWVCPYELVADEAQYWVWSKHLNWSYYSKGPGVSGTIAVSTALFGNSEWAIRLPSVLAGAVAMLALARLAFESTGGNARVAALVAVLFCLIPGYWGMSQLMTTDAPLVACWAVAAWVTKRLDDRLQQGKATLGWWLVLATVVGVGFLYKYTMVLLVPGLVAFAWRQRQSWRWTPRTTATALVAAAWCLVVMGPVFIWNRQHGWPTVAHLLGRDVPRAANETWSYTPYWTLEMIGAQLGMIGPSLILMILAVRRDSPGRWLMLCCALPVLVFYIGVSLITKVEGNWMLAGYSTLVLPAAWVVAHSSDRLVTWLWRATVGYGSLALVSILFPALAAQTPALGRFVPLYRISGARERASRVAVAAKDLATRMGRSPVLIADEYGCASLLSYYLPGHPVVHSAQSQLGGRRSSHDFFADTTLANPKLWGRPAVFVGADAGQWRTAFSWSPIEVVDVEHNLYATETFGGASHERR